MWTIRYSVVRQSERQGIMALAIFDLDNTLLSGDSDYLWGVFLCERGIVDPAYYERQNARFYTDYREGRLDIQAFLAFSLRPLAEHPVDRLERWREAFVAEKIDPVIGQPARDLVEHHRARGDTLLVITATNAFVTRPIVSRFGIEHLIATDPERAADGSYTGRVAGTPSFREGKVERLQAWLRDSGEILDGAWFYSDSHNDLPLLERVSHPVAVDPDERLAAVASSRGWPVLRLHHAPDGKPAPAG
jgi:HAD superfamily hydrolase (TIGR01490 family)